MPNEDADFFTDDSVADAFAEAIGEMRPEEAARDLKETAPAPVDEESTADDDEEQEETDEPDPARNPEGPGNVRAALRQARDEAKTLAMLLERECAEREPVPGPTVVNRPTNANTES